MSEARILEHQAPIPKSGQSEAKRPHLLGNMLWKEPEYAGLELQRIRQSLGISGWDMATALNVPPTAISRAECGDPKFADLRQREQAWLRKHILNHWPRVGER